MEKGDLSYQSNRAETYSPYVMGLLSTTQDLEPLGTSPCEISLSSLVLEDLTCGLVSGITPWVSPSVSMKKGTWVAILMFPDCGSHVTIRFTRLMTSPLLTPGLGLWAKTDTLPFTFVRQQQKKELRHPRGGTSFQKQSDPSQLLNFQFY